MTKILGIDFGTNSIGLSLRKDNIVGDLEKQLEFFSSVIFKSGVGSKKNAEYSYAAYRTKKRSARRLFQSRKYRLWGTLDLLIKNGYCPLSEEDLIKWRTYDKDKGLKREYPITAHAFERWIRLDFDGDGKPDYISPFYLRAELVNSQFDFSQEQARFKLGRALYHIAQHRGFKSSRGETLKDNGEKKQGNSEETEVVDQLKKSEEKKSGLLVNYMKTHNLKTVGEAFAKLEREGVRIRESEYQAVRSQNRGEIEAIFNFQEGLSIDSEFYNKLVSEKKKEGTIFYKRPLSSQKGSVGKCTLEPSKPRCAISRPEFERFRALSFVSNIKYRREISGEWIKLSHDQQQRLLSDIFLKYKRADFEFDVIIKWIQNDIHFEFPKDGKYINYPSYTTVPACPISGRLKSLLGENWSNYSYETTNKSKKGNRYDWEDIWHICFSADEAEEVVVFAKNRLDFDDSKAKEMAAIWGAMRQGYAMLSLKAIRNINHFLDKGLNYSEATLLAKLCDILTEEQLNECENNLMLSVSDMFDQNISERRILTIVNALISKYKALDDNKQNAYRNTKYQLDDQDMNEVKSYIIDSYGSKHWAEMAEENKKIVVNKVSDLYQNFFSSGGREYYRLPKVGDSVKRVLSDTFDFLHCKNNFVNPENKKLPCACEACKKLNKLYHPSQIEYYKPVKERIIEKDNGEQLSLKLLNSPDIGVFKNPVAMRALHILRQQINQLLKDQIIDEDTRIVVEVARDMNDANMRWALDKYMKDRAKENKRFKTAIEEMFVSEKIDRKCLDDDIDKYRLWEEQSGICLYTGKVINLASLYDGNVVDIEHTVPRSKTLDNSLANKTVCDLFFNRNTKKNRIPINLDNYEEILPRLNPWMEKIKRLKTAVEDHIACAKKASDKESKDEHIRNKHLIKMELDYWQNKVGRFLMKDITSGFTNSQLVDTRIISKYAFHYLKSLFNRVEVQKGVVTAEFRKILGVQTLDQKKSRDNHSHHAIDAAVLTMIPVSAKRDEMLKLFYEKKELRKMGADYYSQERKLEFEVNGCNLERANNITKFIEQNIVVNHTSRDQTLTASRRRARVRGRVVMVKDRNSGELREKWLTGDSIRGQLHKETFYGAIQVQSRDKSGKILLRNSDGTIKTETKYVVRKELKYKKKDIDQGFKTWEEVEKVIVNKVLFSSIRGQFENNVSFQEAAAQGIWMLDKNGNRVNRIRHIRCFSSTTNPLPIKKQTYLSNKEYKQYYYVASGDLPLMCKYVSDDLNTKKFIAYRLFDICENRKAIGKDVPQSVKHKKKILHLTHTIKRGEMVLVCKKRDVLNNSGQISDYLYVVNGFESESTIILIKHDCAKQEKDLGKGESIKDEKMIPQKIRQSANEIELLFNGIDFRIDKYNNIELL